MKCELCTMDATHLLADKDGVVHYYCDHHAPAGATRIGSAPAKNNLKTFLPLIAAFIIVAIGTEIISLTSGKNDLVFLMRIFEGFFFAIFGGMKLLNLSGFADAYQTYDLLAKRSRKYAFAYPFIELLLAFGYFSGFMLHVTAGITFVLMAIGTIGVSRALSRKEEIPCACLGIVFKVPMTYVTAGEDVLMALMALYMFFS